MVSNRAIIWCAVSSEEQAKDDKTSLETQERDARNFADENDMLIVDVLIVGGFSRRFYNYPEFVEAAAEDGFYDPARMIEHWRNRDFDVLIARDGSRVGREQGILGEFVARTIYAGARLYMNSGGWVAKDNYREYIALNGYSSAKEMDKVREGSRATKIRSAERGLTTNSRHPYSHRWVRNEAGKLVRLELDESKRPLWDDLATIFLEGISYRDIERALYERYGHVDERTGKPFTRYFFHRLLFNPYAWGNAARSFRGSTTKNGAKVGAWAYDTTCPAPEGVHIFYNVNAAIYTGEQAERVKSELNRRSGIRGRTIPNQTHRFTGLLVCGHCGHYMVYNGHYAGNSGYRCQSYRMAQTGTRCERQRSISERKVQAWLHARLTEMVATGQYDLLAQSEEKSDLQGRVASIRRDIETLQTQARGLVINQSQAPANLAPIYSEQVQVVSKRLAAKQHALAEAEREQRSRDTTEAKIAFRSLTETVDELWAWSDTAINQLLHRLMQNRRLVVMEDERDKTHTIVGTVAAPAPHNKKSRKRAYFGRNGKSSPSE